MQVCLSNIQWLSDIIWYSNIFWFVCLTVFNATFNNISVISWLSFLLVEKTTDLSQVTDQLYHIIVYTSLWSQFEITTSVVIGIDCIGNPTTIWSWPRRSPKYILTDLFQKRAMHTNLDIYIFLSLTTRGSFMKTFKAYNSKLISQNF